MQASDIFLRRAVGSTTVLSAWRLAARILANAALTAVLTSSSTAALAAQQLDVRDGDTTIARISLRDQTRVRVDRARITEVLGDIYDAQRNPAGRVVLVKDDQDGEIYLRPVTASSLGEAAPMPAPGAPQSALAPIKLDLKSDRGTFALLLQPVDVPGDTLVLRPVGPPPIKPSAEAASRLKGAAHVRAIKALTLAMANPDLASEVPPQWLPGGGEEKILWKEARVVLKARHAVPGMVGEVYELTNVSPTRMVLDERELFDKGVLSVALRRLVLAPGETTPLWVIRQAPTASVAPQ